MEEYLSPALRQPPLPEFEKKRLRELSRYYCTIRQPFAFPQDPNATPTPADFEKDEPDLNVAHLSSDITLTALTQLGVYRFGCMRSYVSLIDGQNQHIISEATASISLRDRKKHKPDDGLYLGVTTLDLIFGVCPHAVKLFSGFDVPHLQNTANVTANKSRYIVRDFTLEEYFKDRPYVTEWPYFRFYAEVPIYSPSGHILGSYCVVDNKPRQDFSEDDVVALQEVSDAIALHLENVRTVHYHRRSDRLVRGLTTFVKDRPHERNPLDAAASPSVTSDLPPPERLGLSELSLTTDPTGGTSPLFSHQDGAESTEATSLSVALHEAMDSPPLNKTIAENGSPRETGFFQAKDSLTLSSKSTPLITAKDTIPLSKRIANVYAAASALIRESMDVDGVMFVDACRCNSGVVPQKTDMIDWEPLPKNADPRPRTQYPNGAVPDEAMCDTLGLTLNEIGPQNGIPDSLLRELIIALPQGGVLHPDAGSDDHELLETRLAKSFPQAKSLLFIPLWDWNKGQWLAGTFVWTKGSDQERALGLDELHYFKVFGDSIISEIARLDWSQKEKSKFDLISSVSHELRSPLHGMLANAELLSASLLQPEQRDTVKALETCGITLLDTMNHLLDFAKINNLTSINQSASSVTSLVSTFDLDVLIEEVINSVFSGMRHAAIASTPTASPASNPDTAYKRDLSVVLRFENQGRWKVTSMTGAWRRIVMNILGNALKYTSKGFVEVSVSLLDPPVESDLDSAVAHLRFVDSGRGMSQEFLRNKLFSPFAQEDALAEGAGLGLSIVKQLVSFLKGSIDVKSEPGVGTQVDIFIPVDLVPDVSATGAFGPELDIGQPKTKFSLVGLDAYPELSEEPTGTLSAEAKRRICLQGFFAHLLGDKPDWKISSAASLADADGDIAIINEATLKQLYEDESLRRRAEKNQTRFVCLCDGVPTLNASGPGGSQVVRLYQPYSPRKVLQAIKSAIEAKPQPFAAADDQLPPVPKLSLTTDFTNGTPAPVNDSEAPENKVLIVDDNEINIKVLAKLMTKLGYQHATASNGLIAVNKYKESPASFSMVLMDVSMPVMDGIDATRHIRAYEREKRLTPVKVFAVTGIGSAAMQQEALIAGVDEYLVKPLSLGQLGKLIKVHL
ncbi:hypothetical protein BDW74DRAFT_161893 [Aspergillus multicolor]|uniref:hybrid sensor histidine kinase/response regulator n=1 Tax=Aspergillus multicolor TaxID=41759 RepID=UPI003CCD914C